jgi:hypothetical protein
MWPLGPRAFCVERAAAVEPSLAVKTWHALKQMPVSTLRRSGLLLEMKSTCLNGNDAATFSPLLSFECRLFVSAWLAGGSEFVLLSSRRQGCERAGRSASLRRSAGYRRLRCGARSGVAPQNSLHSLCSLRSNNRGESDMEALRADPRAGLAGRTGPSGPAARQTETVHWTVSVWARLLAAEEARSDLPARSLAATLMVFGGRDTSQSGDRAGPCSCPHARPHEGAGSCLCSPGHGLPRCSPPTNDGKRPNERKRPQAAQRERSTHAYCAVSSAVHPLRW